MRRAANNFFFWKDACPTKKPSWSGKPNCHRTLPEKLRFTHGRFFSSLPLKRFATKKLSGTSCLITWANFDQLLFAAQYEGWQKIAELWLGICWFWRVCDTCLKPLLHSGQTKLWVVSKFLSTHKICKSSKAKAETDYLMVPKGWFFLPHINHEPTYPYTVRCW